MFEKELRIERDIFGRFILRRVDTPESMMIQLVLLVVGVVLALGAVLIFIPLKILITKPDRVSFWTYLIWLTCFGGTFYASISYFVDLNYSIPAVISQNGTGWTVFIIIVYLTNILAIVSRVVNFMKNSEEA